MWASPLLDIFLEQEKLDFFSKVMNSVQVSASFSQNIVEGLAMTDSKARPARKYALNHSSISSKFRAEHGNLTEMNRNLLHSLRSLNKCSYEYIHRNRYCANSNQNYGRSAVKKNSVAKNYKHLHFKSSKHKLYSNFPDEDDKSKDFFDDATMEHVRHNLFQLSSISGMITGGPPSAITFHSTVSGRRLSESGKANLLLHWSPENMIPDSWVPEDMLHLHLEKTVPVSHLPHDALALPELDAVGILSPASKRRRK